MQTSNDFLDSVKIKHGIGSDYALAAFLGTTRSMISRYRKERDYLGDDMALKIAELLDLPEGYVMACAHAERARSEPARRAWSDVAKKFISSTPPLFALMLAVDFVNRTYPLFAQCILCKITQTRYCQ